MRKVLVILVLGVLVLSSMPSSARAFGIDLEYTMIVENPESHKVQIELVVSNLSSSYLNLTFFRLFDFFPHEVTDFEALGENEEILKVNFSEAEGQRFWKMNTSQNKKIKITYTLNVSYYYDLSRDEGYRGYLGKEYGMSMGAWTFLAPTGSEINRIKINFNLPKGWRAITPWKKSGRGYETNDFEYFITSVWAIGRFDIYQRKVFETKVKIAIYEEWDDELKNQIAEYSFKIFEYCRNLFGEPSVPYYVAVYVPSTHDGKNMSWIEWTQGQGLVINPKSELINLVGEYAHRVFHTWNGWRKFGFSHGNKEFWFIEGMNIYYDWDRIPFDLGLDKSHSILKSYDYPTYLNKYYNTKWDVPVVDAWKFRRTENNYVHLFLNYRKGALISFLLDCEIRERTNGEKNLNDLIGVMYSKYGKFGNVESGYYSIPPGTITKKLTNSMILEELNDLTKSDFSEFFNDYIYGIKKLELDKYFKDSD
ncbi:MAG: hypothetical protein ACE5K0_06240, partial [Candidatus Methanofastidiosia archaeon]